MGAKDWMLLYAEGEVRPILRSAPALDREATGALVRAGDGYLARGWSRHCQRDWPPRGDPQNRLTATRRITGAASKNAPRSAVPGGCRLLGDHRLRRADEVALRAASPG